MKCPCEECPTYAICITFKKPLFNTNWLTKYRQLMFHLGLQRGCQALTTYLNLPYETSDEHFEEFRRLFKL